MTKYIELMSITKYKLIFGTAREFHNVLWQTLRHYMTDAGVKTKTDIHVFPLGCLGHYGIWFDLKHLIYTAHLPRPGIHHTVLPRRKPPALLPHHPADIWNNMNSNAKSTYDYFKRMSWLTTYQNLDSENNINFWRASKWYHGKQDPFLGCE